MSMKVKYEDIAFQRITSFTQNECLHRHCKNIIKKVIKILLLLLAILLVSTIETFKTRT